MKKLLGGINIFRHSSSSGSAVRDDSTKELLSSPSSKQRSPNSQDGVNEGKRVSRATWESLFSNSKRVPLASMIINIQPTAKVFNLNLDMLMREIVSRMRVVITHAIENIDFNKELTSLLDAISVTTDKLLENGDKWVSLAQYFNSENGMVFCEQSAFPSLVLDLFDKLRLHLLNIKLLDIGSNTEKASSPNKDIIIKIKEELEQRVQDLANWMQVVASNPTIMEKFRSELRTIIRLSAEEYPVDHTYLRHCITQILTNISDKIFTASLVWYLNDCSVVSQTVRLMKKLSEASPASEETATIALEKLTVSSSKSNANTYGHISAAEAAVSDALGFKKANEHVSITSGVESNDQSFFCRVGAYDAVTGLKTLVYILQKTCKFSLVLLSEFEAAEGYSFLMSLIKSSVGSDTSSLIYLFTLLLPLGTGYSGVAQDDDMATILTCGARNISAFIAFRELLLFSLDHLRSNANKEYVEKDQTEQLVLQILTTVLQVYTCDYDNYLALEPKSHTLARTLEIVQFTDFFDAKVIVLRIVEYVCVAARPESPNPKEITSIIGELLIKNIALETQQTLTTVCESIEKSTPPKVSRSEECLSLLMCNCVIRILQNAVVASYVEELSICGLLERGIYPAFVKLASTISSTQDQAAKKIFISTFNLHVNMWSVLTAAMLRHNPRACHEFRELQIHHSLYILGESLLLNELITESIKFNDFHGSWTNFSIFSIFIELASLRPDRKSINDYSTLIYEGVETDILKILSLLQYSRGLNMRQMSLLLILRHILKDNFLAWNAWKSCQGFESVVSILSSLQNIDSDEDGYLFKILDIILEILSLMLEPSEENEDYRCYFKQEIGYKTISNSIVASGVLKTDQVPQVIDRIFELITGPAIPRNKIKNAHATQIIFSLLPHLSSTIALKTINSLCSKIVAIDDSSFTTRKQTYTLLDAGIFRWLSDSSTLPFFLTKSEVQTKLMLLVNILSSDELSTLHLREFLRLIARTMPCILGASGINGSSSNRRSDDNPEIGLIMLKKSVKRSTVPQISLGSTPSNRTRSGYVHVTNHEDKVWPPSSGYSFACWLRIPASSGCEKNGTASSPSLNCEGSMKLQKEGDSAVQEECYCVLSGVTLAMYRSAKDANRKHNSLGSLEIINASRKSERKFSLQTHDQRFWASCATEKDVEMWLRVLAQAENVVSNATQSSNSNLTDCEIEEESLVSADNGALEGYVCILSTYSLEFGGCFVRIYFDQINGCLRVDTSSVSSGPNMNAGLKRSTSVFKNVYLNLLKTKSSDTNAGEEVEKPSHWHHIVLSHRKVVVGSSLLTLYIDGSEVTTKKLSFPSAPSSGPMQCFIGKDIQICGAYPALNWAIGPTWFTEEVLTPNAVICMFLLGPSFSGQFTGNSYRSIGDWPEAVASSFLDRITLRRVEVARAAKRLQLSKLARSTKRQWNDISSGSDATNSFTESVRREDPAEKPINSSKDLAKYEAFLVFIKNECRLSGFGTEILHLLSNFKLAPDLALFSLNTRQGNYLASSHTMVHYVGTEKSCPFDLAKSLPSVGGVIQMLLPLLDNAQLSEEVHIVVKLLNKVLRQNPTSAAEFLEINGFALLARMMCDRIRLISGKVLSSLFSMAVSGKLSKSARSENPHSELNQMLVISDSTACCQLVLCTELRKRLPYALQSQLIGHIIQLVERNNPNALFNCRQLRRSGIMTWVLVYIADVCNGRYSTLEKSALEQRHCVPIFDANELNELLQLLISLLHLYLRMENHIDDFTSISDVILLSLSSDSPFKKETSLRLILIQFLLHEIENDSGCSSFNVKETIDEQQLIASTIVDAVLSKSTLVKKRKTAFETVISGTTLPTSHQGIYPVIAPEGFENVLLEVICKVDSGPFASLEALLSTRVLLHLAQEYSAFAEHILLNPHALSKFKRVLQLHSEECNIYTPLLAYVSNIPIKDTCYFDPVSDVMNGTTSSASPRQLLALPSPGVFSGSEKHYNDSVWEVLGTLVIRNSKIEKASAINAVVLTQIAFQIELSEVFFNAICDSYRTVIKVIVSCLLVLTGGPGEALSFLHTSLSCLTTGRAPKSVSSSRAVLCFDVLLMMMSRCLFEKENFAECMMFLLECIDDGIMRSEYGLSRPDGQKAWLALLVHVLKATKALSENCTFIVLKNISALTLSLSRYLLDDEHHQKSQHDTVDDDSMTENTSNQVNVLCFGVEVLIFLLSTVRLCSEPQIGNLIGTEDQQFFYGILVYCTQTVALGELNGAHASSPPLQKLLESLINSKHLLVQQTKCSSVIVCSSNTTPVTNAQSNSDSALGGHLSRMRSLSTSSHKEFGIGVESDRSFILCMINKLFKMLMEKNDYIRSASILLWQFLLQQRMGVLKELLIVEQRSSLLQNITTSKKEVIDVYHGGFERLLRVPVQKNDIEVDECSSNENWAQFQLWLQENYDLLKDIVLARTEPIYQHLTDVLLTCVHIRKVSANISSTRLLSSHNEVTIHVDFPHFTSGKSIDFCKNDDILDTLYKNTSRKILLKLTHAREGAIDLMSEAKLKWLETSQRMTNSRTIWHVGKDHKSTPKNSGNDSDLLERSIYQINHLSYRLDFTEAPNRMRSRLQRDFENKSIRELDDVSKVAAEESNIDETIEDEKPFVALTKTMEFHEAAQTFRNLMFKTSKLLEKNAERKDSVHSFASELVAGCKFETTKAMLSCHPIITPHGFAKEIFKRYLENTNSSGLSISAPVVKEIGRLISIADSSNDDQSCLPLTLFDVADSEVMQSSFLAVRTNVHSAPSKKENDLDDEEEENTMICTSIISNSDDEDDNKRDTKSASEKEKATGPDKDPLFVKTGKNMPPDSVDGSNTVNSTSDRLNDKEEKYVENTNESLYGCTSRFLHRDDYPPIHCYNATYITGMSRWEGIFLLCRQSLYFVGGYEMQIQESDQSSSLPGTNTSSDLSSPRATPKKKGKNILNTLSDQFNKTTSTSGTNSLNFRTFTSNYAFSIVPFQSGQRKTCLKRWNIKYSSLKQFYRIKYQLRPVAIEFFDTNGSTFFVQFDSREDREEVLKFIFSMPIVNSIFWNPVLRSSAFSLSLKKIRQSSTKRWIKGLISNFEYLMELNTLAGRSFNDLTQYPVFPWVLSDYQSRFLDLEDKSIYRDLSKPMGAIGTSRAAQFQERFQAMSFDDGVRGPLDSPAFHYGTHYSCSAYVINYLIRLQPFAKLAMELQGGCFDHADRLFRSIPSSWASASSENLQDVRELIPEFFYLPEFLYNANNFDLGTTQSGEVVSHVRLPAWAHGDPREFIRIHRQALESKFVSENLHNWIDLIFGYKQRGSDSVKAQNVFMHITYEGNVDIEKIEDPIMRAATISQIENFGQTPSNLFNTPHPQRKVPVLMNLSASGQQNETQSLSTIEAYVKWHTPLAPPLVSIGKDYVFLKKHQVARVLEEPIGDVVLVNEKFQCRPLGCTFAPPRYMKYLEWGGSDGSIKLRVNQSSAHNRELNKVIAVMEGAHNYNVKCATFSEDGTILVTGGEDAVVNVVECMKLHGQRIFKQLARLVGHLDSIESIAINKGLNLIASGSKDCNSILWDLRSKTFIRELSGHTGPVTNININGANGNIVSATTNEMRVWTINGDLLAANTVQTAGLSPISIVISTRCDTWQNGVVCLTGHTNGTIALWGLLYPADIEKDNYKDNIAGHTSNASTTSKPTLIARAGRLPVKISSSNSSSISALAEGSGADSSRIVKVIPSCSLFILKLLLDHRTAVTALKLSEDQRQLLSGDADGTCIRWMDDSIGTHIL